MSEAKKREAERQGYHVVHISKDNINEMIIWLREQPFVSGDYLYLGWVKDHDVMAFKDPQTAMIFKLTFA